MPALLAVHAADPRKELMKKVGKLDGVELFGNQILCAIYERPEKATLKGGTTLYLPDKMRDEDRHQGKVGLIIKMGPMAFVDDDQVQFSLKAEVGDWIVYRPSDGWQITLTNNQVPCRMLTEVGIKMRIAAPDAVW